GRRRPGLLRPPRHLQRAHRGHQRHHRAPPPPGPRLPQPHQLHRPIAPRGRRLPAAATPSIVKSPQRPHPAEEHPARGVLHPLRARAPRHRLRLLLPVQLLPAGDRAGARHRRPERLAARGPGAGVARDRRHDGLAGGGLHDHHYLAGLQTVPGELYEAAAIDGASRWRQFWSITMPMIWGFFTINLVLALKSFLQVFDQIIAMTGGGPGTATESIGALIYRGGFEGGEFGYQLANAVVFMVVIIVFAFVQLRVLRREEVGA